MSEPLHVADWRTESFREWRARYRVYAVYIEWRLDDLARNEINLHGSPL